MSGWWCEGSRRAVCVAGARVCVRVCMARHLLLIYLWTPLWRCCDAPCPLPPAAAAAAAFTDQVGRAESTWRRMQFFQRVRYNIGGIVFSFNDIESGVLRGNKMPPYTMSRPFPVRVDADNDPRASRIALPPPCDPRIHFALNCGASSCPPVKTFTAAAVDEELRVVSMAWCEQDENFHVDPARGAVTANKIFSWYASDFGASKTDILTRVANDWLRGAKKEALHGLLEKGGDSIKMEYFKYVVVLGKTSESP